MAEATAVQEGIFWAKNNNVSNFIIESDCARIINRIKGTGEDITSYGHKV